MAIEANHVASCDRVHAHRVDGHDGSAAPHVQGEQLVGRRSDTDIVSSEPRIQDHDVCPLQQRTVAFSSADACVVRSRGTGARDHLVPGVLESLPVSLPITLVRFH
jgi:hypothetical protein